jgi:ketosteroid isomerase-like protein
MPQSNADTVRAFYASYLAQDHRAAAERLVAGEFVLYEYELEDGQRYRNAEVITVRDGKVTESQVFFGGRY